MKLRDLDSIIYSKTGDIQFVIVYDYETNTDLETDCSFEYAREHYGDRVVKRISAYGDSLVITV